MRCTVLRRPRSPAIRRLPRYSGSVSGGLSFLTIQACAVSTVPQLPRSTARKHSDRCLTANESLFGGARLRCSAPRRTGHCAATECAGIKQRSAKSQWQERFSSFLFSSSASAHQRTSGIGSDRASTPKRTVEDGAIRTAGGGLPRWVPVDATVQSIATLRRRGMSHV